MPKETKPEVKDKDFSGRKGRKKYERPVRNDPSWYNANPQLTKDTTNLPFNWKNGLKLSIKGAPSNNYFSVASVAGLGVMCTMGNSSIDTLNTIANNLYSYVRYANSGSKNYEAPDVFMYCGAISSGFALAGFIAKMIGLTNVASPINRAYPRQLFSACGINYDDAIANIAAYRGRLNRLIVRLNAYNVPKRFYVYAAHVWALNQVLIESTNGKDQLYVTYPTHYMYYDGTYLTSGGCLRVNAFNNYGSATIIKLSVHLQALETLITNLETDEDIGIISGDLLKVCGKENCFVMGTVPEDYVCLPQHDEAALWKVKNCRILPCSSEAHMTLRFKGTSSGPAAGGAIYYQIANANLASQIATEFNLYESTPGPATAAAKVAGIDCGLIDLPTETPTMDEINEVCAWKYNIAINAGGTDFKLISWGVVVVTELKVVFFNGTDWVQTGGNYHLSNEIGYPTKFSDQSSAQNAYTKYYVMQHFLTSFKYFHFRETRADSTNVAEPSTATYYIRWRGDFTNVHLLTCEEFDNIMDSQLLSMFAIPAAEHLGRANSYAK